MRAPWWRSADLGVTGLDLVLVIVGSRSTTPASRFCGAHSMPSSLFRLVSAFRSALPRVATSAQARQRTARAAAGVDSPSSMVQVRRLERAWAMPPFTTQSLLMRNCALRLGLVLLPNWLVVEAQARGNDPALAQVDVVFHERRRGLRVGLAPAHGRPTTLEYRRRCCWTGSSNTDRSGGCPGIQSRASRCSRAAQRGREAHFAIQLVVAQARGRPVGAVEAAFRATGQAFIDARSC